MEQNKFEKDVRRELDGLKINPSESVWHYVEQRIVKKDKRDKGFIWMFFLLLFMALGGYWLMKPGKNNEHQPQEFQAKEITTPNLYKNSPANKSSIPGKNDTSKYIVKKAREGALANNSKLNAGNSYKLRSIKSIFLQKDFFNEDVQSPGISQDKNNVDFAVENAKKLQNNLQGENKDLANNEAEKIEMNKERNSPENVTEDSLTDLAKSKKLREPGTATTITNSKKLAGRINKGKWNFGITLSGGKSIVANSPLGIKSNYNNDLSSSPNTGSGGGGQVYYYISSPKNSFAFTGGIFAEKSIAIKNRISIGINYKYFSTTIDVGSRIDSAQTAYNPLNNSSVNTAKIYHNDFYYIELPVSLKFQLGNSKSLPIYWQGGINLSQLISSNALQYKSDPPIYYEDNSLFNKGQLGFSTGFSATLFARQKTSLSIGPYFYYSPSKVADKGLYAEKHFTGIGISAEILFKK